MKFEFIVMRGGYIFRDVRLYPNPLLLGMVDVYEERGGREVHTIINRADIEMMRPAE